MIWIIGVVIGLFLIHWIRKKFKIPKVGNMVMIDGQVKSGKTTFGLALAYKTYKRNCFAVRFRNFFNKLFNRQMEEKPLFYTTIPVSFPHVLLTRELLQRNIRFAYKSVIFVDEASLFADSTLVKNYQLNDDLLLFNKLIAHETKGGTIIYNSQSISDVHFSIRRCLSQTIYVHNTFKWLPFLLVCTVREERYREDGTSINAYNDDLEESLRRVIIPKKIWKMFDCYCYSVMTDHLPVENKVVTADSLKAKKIVSFNPSHCVDMNKREGEKNA